MGNAGARFRKTLSIVGSFLHIRERAQKAPDLAWTAVEGAATEKHASALLNYAKKETEAIEIEFRHRTQRFVRKSRLRINWNQKYVFHN
jgi:hypothetical protein